MSKVLIISAEPRLVDVIKGVLTADSFELTVVDRWAQGQARLFKDRFDFVVLDYECLKLEALNAFITIDNILLKENTVGLLLVRAISERSQQLEQSLQSIRKTLDMSVGKPAFVKALAAEIARHPSEAKPRDFSTEDSSYAHVEFELPSIQSGSLQGESVIRALYACRIRKESGWLTVKSGQRSMRFGLNVGELVIPEGSSRGEVLNVFSWERPSYAFESAKISGSSESMLDFLRDGLSKVRREEMLEGIGPVMSQYPAPTNLWEDRKSQLDDFAALHAIARLCDGKTSWTEVLNRMGSLANQAMAAGYFAQQTDLIYTQESPGARGVLITYGRAVRQARQKVADTQRKSTKAFRAASGERDALESELREQLQAMREKSPHEIFEVWEGCGSAVVRDQFYVLVKEHHPDVYGGNVTGQVKTYAQEIFIGVKNAYKELLKVEREQTVGPPPEFGAGLDAASEPSDFARTEGTDPRRRSLHETPGPSDRMQRTRSAVGTPILPHEESEASVETPRVDVKSRIEKLSGFRRRQARKSRRRSTPGKGLDMGSEVEDLVAESEASEVSEAEESAPETSPEEAERQAKLERLRKKAEDVGSPNTPDPAKDAFNEGYRAFREDKHQHAYACFKKAHDLKPEDGLYLTFYGYLMFKLEPEKLIEAEELIRKALQTGNRQAMPDACLFFGHILKAKGQTEKAYKQYRRALKLNPASVEAQREVRLAKMRDKRRTSEPGTFIKNLFKK